MLVGIPNREAIDATIRFWPQQPVPESQFDGVIRIGRYVRASDGADLLALPLYVAAGAGVLLSWFRWERLTPSQRTLVGTALGWVVLGIGLIVISAYRPNRYVVPMLPGLAVLGGIGAALLLPASRCGRHGWRARRRSCRPSRTRCWGSSETTPLSRVAWARPSRCGRRCRSCFHGCRSA